MKFPDLPLTFLNDFSLQITLLSKISPKEKHCRAVIFLDINLYSSFSGVLLGMACDRLPTSDFTLRHYISASTFLLLSGLATYGCLVILGYDPLWSVALAMKWCKEKDWIHLNTTLFAALITDAGSLLGKPRRQA